MKTLFAAALLLATPALAAPVGARAAHQQGRINQGVASGELTRPEAARMQRQHNRLEREIARDRVDGGGLTAKERVKIQHHENQLSKRIYVQKHDGQSR
ncbi:MAG: hypothetical protein IT380_28295 [Myxococcales bacterium]|nr:hypothetical protein [Myxococcales bacterium]